MALDEEGQLPAGPTRCAPKSKGGNYPRRSKSSDSCPSAQRTRGRLPLSLVRQSRIGRLLLRHQFSGLLIPSI